MGGGVGGGATHACTRGTCKRHMQAGSGWHCVPLRLAAAGGSLHDCSSACMRVHCCAHHRPKDTCALPSRGICLAAHATWHPLIGVCWHAGHWPAGQHKREPVLWPLCKVGARPCPALPCPATCGANRMPRTGGTRRAFGGGVETSAVRSVQRSLQTLYMRAWDVCISGAGGGHACMFARRCQALALTLSYRSLALPPRPCTTTATTTTTTTSVTIATTASAQ